MDIWTHYGEYRGGVIMAVKIAVDGSETQIDLPKIINDKMEIMNEVVGGYYTPIYLTDGRIMLVNEDAIALQLPYNAKATLLGSKLSNLRDLSPMAINRIDTLKILGNVLILDKEEWN